MERIVILIAILIAVGTIILGYIFIANTLHSIYASKGDKVKFYELDDKVEGVIVKDNGATVEVEYFYEYENTIVRQVVVVNRMDIFKY